MGKRHDRDGGQAHTRRLHAYDESARVCGVHRPATAVCSHTVAPWHTAATGVGGDARPDPAKAAKPGVVGILPRLAAATAAGGDGGAANSGVVEGEASMSTLRLPYWV